MFCTRGVNIELIRDSFARAYAGGRLSGDFFRIARARAVGHILSRTRAGVVLVAAGDLCARLASFFRCVWAL